MKFDETYPYGAKQNVFKEVAKASVVQSDLLVAEVQVAGMKAVYLFFNCMFYILLKLLTDILHKYCILVQIFDVLEIKKNIFFLIF